ncbi:MAG: hypothetical protein M3Y13_15610 [Armatimonadota bacterium]|nr:hypothetical protein [Armatimonadota bacterium]
MISPAVERELHQQLENLPLGQQRQVLDFARALVSAPLRGVPGMALLPFAGVIDASDLAIMARAADEDCEQINLEDW